MFLFPLWLDWWNRVMLIFFVLSFPVIYFFFNEIDITQSVSFFENLCRWGSVLGDFASIWVPFPESAWIFADSDGATDFLSVSFFFEAVCSCGGRFGTISVLIYFLLEEFDFFLLSRNDCLQFDDFLVHFLVELNLFAVESFELCTFFIKFDKLCRRKVLLTPFHAALLQV